MTHEELVQRAVRWLSGTRRCNPVYAGNASCSEIPDAIGWSSCWKWKGSTVIECKASLSDFRADAKKWMGCRDSRWGSTYKLKTLRWTDEQAAQAGYEVITLPRMGDFRFFLCPEGLVSPAMVEEQDPEHGLLWLTGHRVRTVRDAKRREQVNYADEVSYLRFAILNRKMPLCGDMPEQLMPAEGE